MVDGSPAPEPGESSLLRLARQHPGGFVVEDGGIRAMTPAERVSVLKRRPRAGRRSRSDPRWRSKWLGDWRRGMVENLAHAGPTLELVVVTAPGQDVLPWDTSHCSHAPAVSCSGKLGCRVKAGAAKEWNESAPARFTELHRAAAQRVRRRLGPFKLEAGPVWEPQERGVLHANLCVASHTELEKIKARYYRQSLEQLAPRYGFGFVSRKRRRMTGICRTRE